MVVLFCRSRTIGSLLIRLLTFSRWSHVALVHPDGSAIEATWPRVRLVPAAQIINEHDVAELAEIRAVSNAWEIACAQIGKPYDLSGLWFFLTRRDWQRDDKWFCSELVAYATGGWRSAGRITPEIIYEAST